MLKLKNVSKFYYSNGIVTSGFTKVNLELSRGEFVAITGESGSGKSTLLNVISGLDTYEEGEMYINGEETSAYGSADFENYRRKYIANIYQSFNLINSYTVYQNVDMVLMLSGLKRRERRTKIFDVLKKVDLYKFRNSKASKLSGGQKQRVAIARALVKDTPIIVADEPTGNLDSESAANVIKLLSELASDRLVVVVTHNYDQVEPYVTRKITMHDGRITEDLMLKKTSAATAEEESSSEDPEEAALAKEASGSDALVIVNERKKHLKFGSRLKLGFRNTFNILPKFLLLLFIFVFLSGAVTMLYANMRKSDFNTEREGYNYYFSNLSDCRIVIKKTDKSPITEEDYQKIEALDGVDYVFRDDLLVDGAVYLESTDQENWYYFSGNLVTEGTSELDISSVDYGRLPQDKYEVALVASKDSYINTPETIENILSIGYNVRLESSGDLLFGETVSICGIKIVDDTEHWSYTIVSTDDLLKEANMAINGLYSTITINVAGQEFQSDRWSMYNKVVGSDRVEPGKAVVSSDWNNFFNSQWAPGNKFSVKVSNLYYEDSKEFTVSDIYYQYNFEQKTGYTDWSWQNGVILINTDDYNSFFDKDKYQSSVFVTKYDLAESTAAQLEEMGYTPLYMKDALRSYGGSWVVMDKIFNNIWSGALVIVLFLICYFIIRLIMRSRNVYFATVRMLGGTSSDCRSLIIIELLVALNIAFFLMVGFIYGAAMGFYDFGAFFTDPVLEFLVSKDYIVLYAVLTLMSVIIAISYSRKLFKASAMNVYKEV